MDIQTILDRYPARSEYLIEMLIDIDKEKEFHHITEAELRQVANHINVKPSHVSAVMSFYTLLSTTPRGRYVIQICKDVPCYLNDDFNVLRSLEERLAIHLGETTPDGMFSLEETACIGHCDEAPVIRINDTVHTNLTPQTLDDILASYRRG
jgi:NADH:ubiquinone oxidoreductase subunit E